MIPYEARSSRPKLYVYFFIAAISIALSSVLANVFADYKVLPDYIEKWLSNSSPFLIYSLIFTLVDKFLWKIRLSNYPIGETLLGIPDISGEYRGYNEISALKKKARVKITQTWTHIGVIYYGKDDTPISKAKAVVLDSSNRDLIELDFLYQLFSERRDSEKKSQGMNHGVQLSRIDLRDKKLQGTWFNGKEEQGYLNLTKEGT
ncbi:MAG: hypothetical protein GPI96_17640 [Microcystis aeruginosa BS13-02]|jgi:hypothetical protein|uniref:CD-NTase-associated protein 15 domain-containing protein n=1 Tax=Microcystis aeruginosa Ma_MB_S_20031200_S102 TaxID=2486254 RepID=A0A552EHX0_MICAE|nr:hypothetical protein [Microcystis aeruginosa BS13-02]TRU27268.1 MAG: hypothetical protein EWV79_04350 [Microcystis aeruginosa Ma_MB_S_20031200_S102D]TRU34057.1 MAG: hypothetical protein EWV92_15950 [Microcystis aeruginosa Ma_MB_S_20031200_S102]